MYVALVSIREHLSYITFWKLPCSPVLYSQSHSKPTEYAPDRLPPRQRSICGATGRAKPVCAAWPHVISANRVRSGQAATPAAKHLWGYRESETCVCGAATCDLGHIMTNCRHFGQRPNRDDIAGMEDRTVRWMNAVGDTIWMNEVNHNMFCQDVFILSMLMSFLQSDFRSTAERWISDCREDQEEK